jgi:hypothetical protein
VLAIGALDPLKNRASYSNTGADLDFMAPGGDCETTLTNSVGDCVFQQTLDQDAVAQGRFDTFCYCGLDGTSMATPHVAGIASLMLSRNPSLTPAQVISKLQTTARAFPPLVSGGCSTAICGAGIVDAAAAVAAASAPVPTTTTLATSGTPALAGTTITFTASVAGNVASGTVAFTDGGNAIANCSAVALVVGNPSTASCSTSSLAVGSHTIVASYGGDASNVASASAPLTQGIDPAPAVSTNVALATNGGVASASSTFSGRSPSVTIDNERKGINFSSTGTGGVWKDATPNVYPDWLQVNFNGSKTINRVVVYGSQDNYTAPIEPTDTMTLSLYANLDYTVEAWNGLNWVTLDTVTGNNLVKRTSNFPAFTTDRIRVNITRATDGYSRIAEIEAWTK